MRTHDAPEFVLRTDAVGQYGRSKASFIRDIDKAFVKGETEFLENFRLYLNDGSMIPGPEASKKKMQSLQAMQPWVYIKQSLLDSRYWEKQNEPLQKTKPKRSASEEGSHPPKKLEGVSDAVQLEHENAMLRQENKSIQEKVILLEQNQVFLQDELQSRRGEIEGMTKFVDSGRLGIEAGKSSPVKNEQEPTPENEEDATAAEVVEVVVVDHSEKGSRQKSFKAKVQNMMDFLNQPIGSGSKVQSSPTSKHVS